MRLLLDTPIFLWLNDDASLLSETAKSLCSAGTHDFYLSIASAWEMQIKNQLGKLALNVSVEEMVNKNRQDNNIQILPIDLAHVGFLKHLGSQKSLKYRLFV